MLAALVAVVLRTIPWHAAIFSAHLVPAPAAAGPALDDAATFEALDSLFYLVEFLGQSDDAAIAREALTPPADVARLLLAVVCDAYTWSLASDRVVGPRAPDVACEDFFDEDEAGQARESLAPLLSALPAGALPLATLAALRCGAQRFAPHSTAGRSLRRRLREVAGACSTGFPGPRATIESLCAIGNFVLTQAARASDPFLLADCLDTLLRLLGDAMVTAADEPWLSEALLPREQDSPSTAAATPSGPSPERDSTPLSTRSAASASPPGPAHAGSHASPISTGLHGGFVSARATGAIGTAASLGFVSARAIGARFDQPGSTTVTPMSPSITCLAADSFAGGETPKTPRSVGFVRASQYRRHSPATPSAPEPVQPPNSVRSFAETLLGNLPSLVETLARRAAEAAVADAAERAGSAPLLGAVGAAGAVVSLASAFDRFVEALDPLVEYSRPEMRDAFAKSARVFLALADALGALVAEQLGSYDA